MSDDDYCDLCAFSVVVNGFLNNPLIHFIKSRGSLIKKKDLWFLQESPSDGNSLLLTSGQ